MDERKPFVMLVEDDADSLIVLEYGLIRCGAVVQTYDNAAAALAALEGVVPDVLITDLAMPERDGFWLVEQVRRLPLHARLPIIAVTGHGQRIYVDAAWQAGVDDLLLKPIDSRVIYERVSRLARRHDVPAA
jgi:DNA-binding response OmpR family regulator